MPEVQEQAMRGVVRRWGNSASVRIPAALLGAARMRLDQQVEIREEAGRIVIEPVSVDPCDVEALVAGITDANLHASIDTGPPVGGEVW